MELVLEQGLRSPNTVEAMNETLMNFTRDIT